MLTAVGWSFPSARITSPCVGVNRSAGPGKGSPSGPLCAPVPASEAPLEVLPWFRLERGASSPSIVPVQAAEEAARTAAPATHGLADNSRTRVVLAGPSLAAVACRFIHRTAYPLGLASEAVRGVRAKTRASQRELPQSCATNTRLDARALRSETYAHSFVDIRGRHNARRWRPSNGTPKRLFACLFRSDLYDDVYTRIKRRAREAIVVRRPTREGWVRGGRRGGRRGGGRGGCG